jgi:class 3 adenylate cyclase
VSPRRRSEEAAARRTAAARAGCEPVQTAVVDRPTGNASGVRLRACVVVVSLRGLTQLASRVEPPIVVRLLEEFYGAMTDVAVAHRAMIDTLLGDALLLLYGVPSPRRDDPLRAVRTALDMQRAFLALRNRWLARGEEGATSLGLAAGTASGEVLIASMRPSGWLDYTAVGEPVNAAVGMCAAARAGEQLIDEATYASVHTRLDAELLFTSRAVGSRGREQRPAYRVQPRRAGLRVVPKLAVGSGGG